MRRLLETSEQPAFVTPVVSSFPPVRESPTSQASDSGIPKNPCIFTTTRAFPLLKGDEIAALDGAPVWSPPLHPRGAAVEHAFAQNSTPLSLWLPSPPIWLNQVHGAHVVDADAMPFETFRAHPPNADAIVTRTLNRVLAIQTADCLPVVLFDRAIGQGSTTTADVALAAAHAGWRGLAAGVLEATIRAMGTPPDRLCAWIAPAIGKEAFEVGEDVFLAFHADKDPEVALCFAQGNRCRETGDKKWFCDLTALATLKLKRAGVAHVAAAHLCTYSDPARFFSYRRQKEDGRMVTFAFMCSEK